jgi:hypothetical protein
MITVYQCNDHDYSGKNKQYAYSNKFLTSSKEMLHKNNCTSDYVYQYEHNVTTHLTLLCQHLMRSLNVEHPL